MKLLLAVLLITILCSQGLVSAQYTESAKGYYGEWYEAGISPEIEEPIVIGGVPHGTPAPKQVPIEEDC